MKELCESGALFIEQTVANYAMGLTLSPCQFTEWSEGSQLTFQLVIADLLNHFCHNYTLCNLRDELPSGSSFHANNVVMLDNYPQWDYSMLRLRFIVLYPSDAALEEKQTKPLVRKSVLSGAMASREEAIASALGWGVFSWERIPKYDPITEFMNVALIPLTILVFLAMYLLAHCVSAATSHSEGVEIVSSRSGGGKNMAVQQMRKKIAEEKMYDELLAIQKDTYLQGEQAPKKKKSVMLKLSEMEAGPSGGGISSESDSEREEALGGDELGVPPHLDPALASRRQTRRKSSAHQGFLGFLQQPGKGRRKGVSGASGVKGASKTKVMMKPFIMRLGARSGGGGEKSSYAGL